MKEKKVKSKITLDKLATIIQGNLLSMEENINNKIDTKIDGLKKEIISVKDELKADIKDIKANLNKKVDIFVHNDLKFRVEKLEEKVGAGRKK